MNARERLERIERDLREVLSEVTRERLWKLRDSIGEAANELRLAVLEHGPELEKVEVPGE